MKITVHRFPMGDVEDPALYASIPLEEWQTTDKGRWVKENSETELTFSINPDPGQWGYSVEVYAELDEENLTYYNLKWASDK